MGKYIIGIDLGTTNCTMAYTTVPESDFRDTEFPIDQFEISQIKQAGVQENALSLPSFIYFPLKEELSAKHIALNWDPSRPYCVGTFARERGAEIPSQLISSAKSWLSHAGVDRRSKILPYSPEESHPQMSPKEACTALLKHMREAWDNQHTNDLFKHQIVLVTVPASFDPSARELVLEAAKDAEYPEIVLLEEPQAAFYAWLHTHANAWRKKLKVGEKILVVDIGGGTTDFSLIAVDDENGDLKLTRLAVGDHLLLGGDNLDLALAYLAKDKLENQGHTIDEWQMQALIHASRKAKEALLGENPPSAFDIVIQGKGSKLIGNTLTTSITTEEAEKLLLDGFFPLISPQEHAQAPHKSGLQQIGLPYAQDARVSAQLAKFLAMAGDSSAESFVMPSTVLFNGGTLKAKAIQNRLVQLLNSWAKALKAPDVSVLSGLDLDFGVSRGAAYYGIARAGHTLRIRGGTSKSYFIGVEDSAPAVPGISPPMRAICVAPIGMEEGTEEELENKEFSLLLGELATFRFFSYGAPLLKNGEKPKVGSVVKNWKQELTELHPVETILDKLEGDGKVIRIKMNTKVTELGVLELWCKAEDGRKWKLEFDVRN